MVNALRILERRKDLTPTSEALSYNSQRLRRLLNETRLTSALWRISAVINFASSKKNPASEGRVPPGANMFRQSKAKHRIRRENGMARFIELLKEKWEQGRFLCVGLDTDYQQLPASFRGDDPAEGIFRFNRAIIEATAAYCCAYKPNSAFYEGYGSAGTEALRRTNLFIREHYPEHPIILDAKRADIGNTNLGYLRAAFEVFGADAITVHPYLGQEALKPFLDHPEHGVIVLCHTSNPGAAEFQDLPVGGIPLYQVVAERVAKFWNKLDNCGLVVGATYPEQLAAVRRIVGEMPLLIPGIGAQGGDLQAVVRTGLNSSSGGIIVNASRSVIYASNGPDFATAAAREAARLDQALREAVTGAK